MTGGVCCLASCGVSSKSDTTVSYHRIPKKDPERKLWLKFLRLKTATERMTICSRHFEPSSFVVDYKSQLMGTKSKRTLIAGATPTIHKPSLNVNKDAEREERIAKRARKEIVKDLLNAAVESFTEGIDDDTVPDIDLPAWNKLDRYAPSSMDNTFCQSNNQEFHLRFFSKMKEKAVLSCRGCLTEVDGNDSYFFVLKKVRDLFTECTTIQLMPEAEEDECFPQQLCSACYNKCKEWRSFKEMCQKVDKRLQRKAIKSVPIQEDEMELSTISIKEEMMDVEESSDVESFIVGQVFKEEEEDEEDGESEEETMTENEEEEVKCPVCALSISKPSSLKNHLKEHYSEKNPKCPICDRKFTRSSQLYSHIMSLHKGEHSQPPKEREVQVCPVCKIQTDQLFHHLTTVHLKRNQVKCPVCKKNFKYVKQHLVVHTDDRPFPCGYCDMSFTFESNRINHWRQQHADQETTRKRTKAGPKQGQVECPKCHKIFPSTSQLHIHFVVHTDELPYICNYCTFAARTKGNAHRHIGRCHPEKSVKEGVSIKEDSIFRSDCPWETMGYHGLTRRKIEPPQLHVCKECDKGFLSQPDLRRHSLVHTKERPFHCVYCLEVFQQKNYAELHVRKCHPGKSLDNAVILREGTRYAKELGKKINKRR